MKAETVFFGSGRASDNCDSIDLISIAFRVNRLASQFSASQDALGMQEPGRFVAVYNPRRGNCADQFANPRHPVLALFFGHVWLTLVVDLVRR
jgi:hypothetical protein